MGKPVHNLDLEGKAPSVLVVVVKTVDTAVSVSVHVVALSLVISVIVVVVRLSSRRLTSFAALSASSGSVMSHVSRALGSTSACSEREMPKNSARAGVVNSATRESEGHFTDFLSYRFSKRTDRRTGCRLQPRLTFGLNY